MDVPQWPVRITACASGIKVPWIGCGSYFTYLRCVQGLVCLRSVRDVHSRRAQGYALGQQQSADLVDTTLVGLPPPVVPPRRGRVAR